MASAAEKIASLKTLQSVIFDMDGVIIDSHPAHRKAWREFLLSIDKRVSEDELDFVLDGRKRHEILTHFLGNVSEEQLATYGRKKDDFFQRVALEVKPQQGVLEFIVRLRRQDVLLALATSAGAARTMTTLRRLGLLRVFQTVVTGDDVAEGKPNSAIYRLACERLKVEASNSVAIEDAESGVRAAKSAGLKCLGFAAAGAEAKLRLAGADYVIKDFAGFSVAELQDILN